jgi:hypothetical protein
MEEDLTLGYTIKIGFSENFEKRFKSGYSSYFIYVKILHLYHGDFTKDDELVIKHYFSGHKIYRDEYYNPETERPGIAEIIVAKQRSGSTGPVDLAWLGQYTKFANLVK